MAKQRSEVIRRARKRAQSRAVGKAKVSVDTNVHAPMKGLGASSDTDWKKEEEKRLNSEVAALEKELTNFDPVKAANLVRSSLEIELKRKKLRIEENKLDQTSSLS